MQIMNENPLYSCLGNRLFVLAQIKTFCHVELIFMFSGAAPPPAPPTRTSSFVPKGVEQPFWDQTARHRPLQSREDIHGTSLLEIYSSLEGIWRRPRAHT